MDFISFIFGHPAIIEAFTGFLAMVLLIALSILIALSEISFAGARESRIRAWATEGNKRAISFLKLRQNSGQVITVFQILLNGVGVLGGVIGDILVGPPIAKFLVFISGMHGTAADRIGGIVAFLIVTSAFVLFADLIPKRVAMSMPDKIAVKVSWFPALCLKILYPFVIIFSFLSDCLLKVLHLPTVAIEEQVTPEDLRVILDDGLESGAVSEQEHQMINNVLELQNRTVGSAMTPRDEIIFLNSEETLDSQRELVQAHPYSYYPLCKGGLDSVIGAVRAEDVLAAVADRPSLLSETSNSRPHQELYKMRREVLSLPDSLNLWEALAQFKGFKTGFALIVNEYGLVVGLISYKDILGALMDGFATPFEDQAIVSRDKDSWLIDGAAPIGDVERELHISLEEAAELFETIGGFVTHKLRRMARKTDHIIENGCRFEVVDVDGFRINQLLVTKLPLTPKTKILPSNISETEKKSLS